MDYVIWETEAAKQSDTRAASQQQKQSSLQQSVFNYAFSSEPILLNGMKVIFDQPVSVYPVNLESKEEAHPNGT